MFLFFSGAVASAQSTYYFSANGNDSADGLTPATAFKSLYIANTLTLTPGDKILLERGSVWRGERLALINAAGTTDKPISIGTYGTGDKPTIYGSVPVSNSGWTPVPNSPNVYSRTLSTIPTAMYADNKFLQNIGLTDFVAQTPNSWARNGSTVVINTGGRDISTLPVSAGLIDRNIWLIKSQNVVVEDIIVRDSANSNAGESFKVDTSKNITWRNLEAINASQHHFEVIDTNNFLGENLKASFAEPGRGGSAFVSYSGVGSTTGHDDHVWRNISYEDTSRYMLFYTHGDRMGDILVENPKSIGDTRIGIQTEGTNQHVVVRGGEVSAFNLQGSNILVDGVHLTGPKSIISIDGNNNIVQNILAETTDFDTTKNALFFVQGKDNIIRNNTLIMDPSITGEKYGLYVHPNGSAEFYGNVMTNFPFDIRVDGLLKLSELNAYDHGTFMQLFASLGLAQWNTLGYDKNSIDGPLSFEDPANDDYRLLPNQPASGLIPENYTNRPLTDYYGAARPLTGRMDPGAFQGVPEASTLVMVGIGTLLAGLYCLRRRRSLTGH
jgi:hypothetical protein